MVRDNNVAYRWNTKYTVLPMWWKWEGNRHRAYENIKIYILIVRTV